MRSAFIVSFWGLALAGAAHGLPSYDAKDDIAGVESRSQNWDAAATVQHLIAAEDVFVIGEKTVSDEGADARLRLQVDARETLPLIHIFNDEGALQAFLAAKDLGAQSYFKLDAVTAFKLIKAPHFIALNSGAPDARLFTPRDVRHIAAALETRDSKANQARFSDALRSAAFATPGLKKMYLYAHPELPSEMGEDNYLLILVADGAEATAQLQLELRANLQSDITGVGTVETLVLTEADAQDVVEGAGPPFFER